MNTDKLMELERKWRGMNCRTEAQDRVYRVCADELAAALRAEQAVGDEQRARELFADELEKAGMAKTAKHCRAGNLIAGHQRAIRRALGTARQSEGVGKLRAFAKDVLDYWPDGAPDGGDLQEVAIKHGLLIATPAVVPCSENCACMEFYDEGDTADCYHRAPWLIAAAPGGEGEG